MKRRELSSTRELKQVMGTYYRDLARTAEERTAPVAWCTSVGPAELLYALGFRQCLAAGGECNAGKEVALQRGDILLQAYTMLVQYVGDYLFLAFFNIGEYEVLVVGEGERHLVGFYYVA